MKVDGKIVEQHQDILATRVVKMSAMWLAGGRFLKGKS